jgi:hypothetical protein
MIEVTSNGCWQSCKALFDATPVSILRPRLPPSPATLENAKLFPPGRFVRDAGAMGRWQLAAGPFFLIGLWTSPANTSSKGTGGLAVGV